MATIETNFRDELKKLAEVSDILENSVFSNGKFSVIVELESKDFKELVGYLSPIDINKKRIVIDISGVEFTLVLSK